MQRRARHARRVGAAFSVVAAASCLLVSRPAGADDGGAVKGAATASAETLALEITSGGAAISITLGRSTAAYQDITASAQGRALDLGILGDIMGLPQCNGAYPPLINPETMPPVTAVDSFSTDAGLSRVTEVRYPAFGDQPAGAIVGTQDARAQGQPWAQANTTTVDSDLLLLSVAGGRSESSVEWVRNTRVARAVSTADQVKIMGGLITFTKPRWEAVARSGAEESSTTSFTFESATMMGIYRSPSEVMADLRNFKWGIQQLLSGLGVIFQLPEARPTPDGGLEIAPMGFIVRNPPIGRDLIVPFLSSDYVTHMRDLQIAEDCRKNTDWTIIAALQGAFAGTGDIKILVGGARVATDATDYSFHPSEQTTTTEPAPAPATEPSVDAGTEVAYDTSFVGGGFDSTAYDTGAETYDLGTDLGTTESFDLSSDVPAEEIVAEAAGEKESTELDEIASPSREPASGNDAAGVAVGVVALIGALGLSLGDRMAGRRSRRRIA